MPPLYCAFWFHESFFILSVCGGLNSAIFCVYLIIVLLFYYYLGLSVLYLGLYGLNTKTFILLFGFVSHFLFFFFFFPQVLNSNYSATSNYSAKWHCNYNRCSFFFFFFSSVIVFFFFPFKYLCKLVDILL